MPTTHTTIMAPASTCIACGQPARSTPGALQQQVADLTAKLQQAERTLEEYAAKIISLQTQCTLLGQLAHQWISVACQETGNAEIWQKGIKAQGVLSGPGLLPLPPLHQN